MLVNRKNQVKDGQDQESNTDQEPKVFITLNDPDRGKGNRLNNFLTQLRQNHRGSTFRGFWKQEFQECGAVHYHLIIVGYIKSSITRMLLDKEFWNENGIIALHNGENNE